MSQDRQAQDRALRADASRLQIIGERVLAGEPIGSFNLREFELVIVLAYVEAFGKIGIRPSIGLWASGDG